MDTFTAIETRRSVKSFDPSHELSAENERQLFEAAILAPTAFNIQNWRFVAVKDRDLRRQIQAVSWNQPQITECSLLLVLCGDLKAWARDPARYWRTAPSEMRDKLATIIGHHYEGRDQLQRDEAFRSCGFAAQTLMLAARAMGLDSCPMTGCDFDAVGKLIRLPRDHAMVMMLAIGKALEPARPRGGQLAVDEVVITDRF